MAEAAFTPGPWLVSHEQSEPPRPFVCTEGDVICLMEPGHPADDPSDAANVHLIAAAPELFGLGELALRYMENELGFILESHCLLNDQLQPIRDTLEEDEREVVEQIERDIESARAILAKARGNRG